MRYYTLTKESAEPYAYMLPADINYQIGRNGYFTVAAMESGHYAAGVLQFYIEPLQDGRDFTSVITFLYVDKAFRRQGVGTLLLMKMDRILEGARVYHSAFRMPEGKAFAGMKTFLTEYGYTFRESSLPVYTTQLAKVLDQKLLERQLPEQIRPLSQMNAQKFRRVFSELEEVGLRPVAADFEPVVTEYDPALSSFYHTRSGSGMFLLKRFPSGRIEPVYLKAKGKNAKKGCLMLISRTLQQAKELCDGKQLVRIFCRSKESVALVQGLYPKLIAGRELTGSYALRKGAE